jgi:glutathione peroxidase
MDGVYDFSAARLDGQPVPLSQFRDQVLLIVNTASKCGFTPQYEGLETLYLANRARGFSVLGFPCNQFGGQEPGTADDIAAFCSQSYKVTFPIFAKIDVNGAGAHPLYKYLKRQQPGVLGSQAIKWNFTKFLVDRKGQVVARHAPTTSPASLAGELDRLLAQAPVVRSQTDIPGSAQ